VNLSHQPFMIDIAYVLMLPDYNRTFIVSHHQTANKMKHYAKTV